MNGAGEGGKGALGEGKCREILEVDPDAAPEAIRHAYLFLKGLYAPGETGLALPDMDEFSAEARARILSEIEAAYRELCTLQEAAQPPPPAAPPPPPDPERSLDGVALRQLREASGFTLERLAGETSVRAAYLGALEEERFRDLPSAPVIVRGYLTAYLAAMGLPSEAADRSVADYVKRFQRWQGKP